MLGFNDMSTLVGHFVSSPRERKKRDRRGSRGDEREGQERKKKMNESEETEEIKIFTLYPYLLQERRPCPAVSQSQLDAPVCKIHTTFASTNHPCSIRKESALQKGTKTILAEFSSERAIIPLTLVLLNKLRGHAHFWFLANQIT